MSSASSYNYRVLRYALLGRIGFAILLVGGDLIGDPAVITSQLTAALIYLTLLVALLAIYAAFAIFGTRPTNPDAAFLLRRGAGFGLLVGAMWILEIFAGNIGDSTIAGVRLIYYGAILGALAFTLLGGIVGGQRSGRFESGAMLGLWSGLVSGLLAFLAGMMLHYLFLPTLQLDSQTIAEFQRSGAVNLHTYIISDALVGFTNHLWIGPLLGLILGATGGFIGANLNGQPAAGNRVNSL